LLSSDCLFPSSPLWNPQDHYCSHWHNTDTYKRIQPIVSHSVPIYTSFWNFCTLPRPCEICRFITMLRDPTTSPCKWNQSAGSHYIPDLYIASDGLFTSLPLWNPEVHYCAHRPNHQLLQMNPVCRLTLCSRSILRFGWSVPFHASVNPTGS
jgi:hypothetical protein